MKENFDRDDVWDEESIEDRVESGAEADPEEDGLGTDIYQFYMEELSAITPCTEEENARLLSEIREGKAEARERLIEGNLKGVLLIIKDYLNKGVPMADLIQEASLELVMLADEGFEGSFEKLLESRVRVRMEEAINENRKELEKEEEMLARVNVLQEVSKVMAEELGREANLKELAERMQMTEDEVREVMRMTMDALNLSELNREFRQ